MTSEPIINYILFLFDANVDYLARPGVGNISVAVEGQPAQPYRVDEPEHMK